MSHVPEAKMKGSYSATSTAVRRDCVSVKIEEPGHARADLVMFIRGEEHFIVTRDLTDTETTICLDDNALAVLHHMIEHLFAARAKKALHTG